MNSNAEPHNVENVADNFAKFADYLETNRSDYVKTIVEAGNGFEGWLKLEYYHWLRGQNLAKDDVGMEYALNKRRDGYSPKRCDLWIRRSRDRFHYVELKAPFAIVNAGKMLRAGGWDLWHMMNIDAVYEQASSGNLILVGVGFTNTRDWEERRGLVRTAAAIASNSEPCRSGVICEQLHWDVWTHEYE